MGKYRAYESYKDSGVEWLGTLPKHWKVNHTKRFADISYGVGGEIDRGLTKGINLLSLPNVTKEGNLLSEETSFCKINDVEKQNLLLQKGDLLFNWRNGSASHLGKTAYFDLDGEWTHVSFLLKLRFNLSQSDSKYFQYMLNGLRITEFFIVSKAGVNNTFNLNELSNLKVICPPIEEQKTIARFLDYKTKQIDALIAKKEALLEKLDEKRTALISHAVTKGLDATVPMKDSGIEWIGEIPGHWEIKKLKYIAGQFIYGTSANCNVETTGIPVLRIPNIETGKIALSDLKYTNLSKKEEDIYLVNQGDILIVRTNGNPNLVGRSALIRETEKFLFASYLIKIVPFKDIDYEFFILSLNSDCVRQSLTLRATTSAGNYNINSQSLKDSCIAFPPKDEQKEIAEYLEQKTAEIDDQKAKIQQAINLLKEYRTALITNAVTGKIDVRQVPI